MSEPARGQFSMQPSDRDARALKSSESNHPLHSDHLPEMRHAPISAPPDEEPVLDLEYYALLIVIAGIRNGNIRGDQTPPIVPFSFRSKSLGESTLDAA